MLIPPALCNGDRIAIVSPASKIDAALIDAAASQLRAEGFEPVVMPHAKGECGSFSGTSAERLADLEQAINDPAIRAILCSRGGYGAVHLLEELDRIPAAKFNKWLIGFSDITALHALWNRKGVASLHAAMTKHIGRGSSGFECYDAEIGALRGIPPHLDFPSHPYNRTGCATGPLVGGNMAVFGALVGTPFNPVTPGAILFMEDIAEPIYKVERILWQLRLAGVFDSIAGVVVGQFTDYRPSADHANMADMISSFLAPYSFPVAFDFPAGHVEANFPLLMSATATLDVSATTPSRLFYPSSVLIPQ